MQATVYIHDDLKISIHQIYNKTNNDQHSFVSLQVIMLQYNWAWLRGNKIFVCC